MRPYIERLSTELWLQSPCGYTASALTLHLLHSFPKQHLVFCRARAYQVELSEGTCSPGFNCVPEFHWKVRVWAVNSQISEMLPESHHPSRKDEWPWAALCSVLADAAVPPSYLSPVLYLCSLYQALPYWINLAGTQQACAGLLTIQEAHELKQIL